MGIATANHRMTYIYALADPREIDDIKRIRYIGKATGAPLQRYRVHLSNARHGVRTHCYNWIRNLFGVGLFPVQCILESVPQENGAEAEQKWIRSLRERDAPLTNLTDGGDGVLGYRPSEETRRRLSVSAIGNGNARGHRSIETRAKISAVNTGKKLSPETRARMSVAKMGNKNLLGHHHSDESIAKMSMSHMGNKSALGYHHSKETRAKLSAAHQGKKLSAETRAKMSVARSAYWINKVTQ